MKVLPPVRNTYVGLADSSGECLDCGVEWLARNALGLANQHARRTGHHTRAEQTRVWNYNRKDKP